MPHLAGETFLFGRREIPTLPHSWPPGGREESPRPTPSYCGLTVTGGAHQIAVKTVTIDRALRRRAEHQVSALLTLPFTM
jgi:hypothetical protein